MMICTQYLSVSSKGNNDCLSDICWKKKKKKKQTNKKNSKPINFHTGWKNQQQGRQNKRISTEKKKEKAKKEGLTMRLPILSYNQADLSKLCGQIVFKR